jgi:hypothetical protein
MFVSSFHPIQVVVGIVVHSADDLTLVDAFIFVKGLRTVVATTAYHYLSRVSVIINVICVVFVCE